MGLLPLARNVPGHFGVVYAANIPPPFSPFFVGTNLEGVYPYMYTLIFDSHLSLNYLLFLSLSSLFLFFFSHELNGKFEWRVSGICYINVVECRHRLPSSVQSSKIGNPPSPD